MFGNTESQEETEVGVLLTYASLISSFCISCVITLGPTFCQSQPWQANTQIGKMLLPAIICEIEQKKTSLSSQFIYRAELKTTNGDESALTEKLKVQLDNKKYQVKIKKRICKNTKCMLYTYIPQLTLL